MATLEDTLDADYEHALVHAAWLGRSVDGGRVENRLVFGMVELVPRGCPTPTDEPSSSLNLADDGILRVARSAASARTAVDWYRAFGPNHALFPSVYSAAVSAKSLQAIGTFVEEPDWPSCSTAPSDTSAAPLPLVFVPDHHTCPRVHHRLVAAPPSVFSDAARSKALSWLSDHLFFHVDQHQHLLGSLHLVAPNPIFQDLRARVVPEDRALALHAVSLNGRSLDGLTLRLRNHQSSGVTSLHDHALDRTVTLVRLPTTLGMVSWEIVCKTRGLLYLQPETTFIARIEGNIGIVTERRRVEVPAPPDGTPATIDVTVATRERFLAGTPEPQSPDVRRIALRARERRERLDAARRSGQRFFFNGQAEADRTLREIINGAQREALFVDPYFTANEIQRFALAVGTRAAGVSVLTWAGTLKRPTALAVAVPAARGKSEGQVLEAHTNALNATGQVNPISVRVMGGKDPPIHDRFLVVDDDVWLLGSSFNSFGKSGTILTKLIDPEAVRGELARQYSNAALLADWIAQQPQPKPTLLAFALEWLRARVRRT